MIHKHVQLIIMAPSFIYSCNVSLRTVKQMLGSLHIGAAPDIALSSFRLLLLRGSKGASPNVFPVHRMRGVLWIASYYSAAPEAREFLISERVMGNERVMQRGMQDSNFSARKVVTPSCWASTL